jgi:succinate dehydrogenase/fumarate reductase flavoprotein subunit
VAARSAQLEGASVVVLEKAAEIGGSAAALGGQIWCAHTVSDWQTAQPDGDVALGRALVEGYTEGIAWLPDQGVPVTPVSDLVDGAAGGQR